MATTTIRISKTTQEFLHVLASQDNTSMQTIVEQAIEQYRRHRFLEGLNADFTNMRKNNKGWHDELEERQQWNITIGDGQES